ncbi:MAG: hypothetical protein JWR35_2301 [Marmoricola sp.]|nr:hypothetical protein [Marmoricola sp.]
MRRTIGLIGTLTLLLGSAAGVLTPAEATPDTPAKVVAPAVVTAVVTAVAPAVGPAVGPAVAPVAAKWSLAQPFTREGIKTGTRDNGPQHIQHVREVQLRLARTGLYKSAIDGVFGASTEKAVKAFQARWGLRQTGAMNPVTWAKLIPRTTYGVAPKVCDGPGWHMCVDRKRHQASLFKNGALYNSWLVRTGQYTLQTRTGSFNVYWRDIAHVSHQYGGGMPYSQFFSGGQALHGSELMTNPFDGHSHGCVNFYIEDARQLWNLTHNAKLTVTVYGAWD